MHAQLLYAIARKSDGALLVQSKPGHHTRNETFQFGVPRLFYTIGGAKTSLRMWCQGIWHGAREWESTDEYGSGFYYMGLPEPIGKHARNPDDYEVIPVSLSWAEPAL